MISPYVRRLRLAAELRALRTEAGLTHEQLAKRIHQSRAQISRLENGHVVDLDDVDLTDLDLFSDGPPHAVFRALRDRAPVFWHEPTGYTPGGEGFWCLTRYEDVQWAARETTLLSSETGGDREGGGTLIEDLPTGLAAGVVFNMQDDPRHHHIRRLITPSLSPRRLRALEGDLAERCAAILDAAVAQGTCDLLVDIAAELPLQAVASLLGVPQEDRHRFMAWADATLDYEDRDPGADSERSQQASAEMFAYGGRLLEHKRACPADDIMSIVANAELPTEAAPGGPLTDLEQQMFFNLLIAAGSETTRNAITAGVIALMERPEQWQALRRNRNLVPGTVEEILRWSSSTAYNRRTATADFERHGETVRAGDKVVLWWPAANFDERVFDEPTRFDIHRDPNPHLTFGTGTHFCLGANLARLEMRLVFDGLLDRVSHLEPAGPVERTRSNKHLGFRHAPVRLVAGPSS
jgi:cytochrome P450